VILGSHRWCAQPLPRRIGASNLADQVETATLDFIEAQLQE
jgi:hypothetical protein